VCLNDGNTVAAPSTAKELHDPLTASQGEHPDVLPHDVVRQHGIGDVEVLVLQGIEKVSTVGAL
jgi:hypothetical protein